MALRFLLDEHISPAVAAAARREGLDVEAVAASPLSGRPDAEVFRDAVDRRRIVVTYDIADFVPLFHALLNEGLTVPGLVLVEEKTIPSRDVRGLVRALRRLARAVDLREIDPAGGVFLQPSSLA